MHSFVEVKPEFVLDPGVRLRALFASVQVPFSSQLPREELADSRDVASLLLKRNGNFALVPRLETLHLTYWGGVLHPLDHLHIIVREAKVKEGLNADGIEENHMGVVAMKIMWIGQHS